MSRLARLGAVLLVLCTAVGCSFEQGGSLSEYLTDARIQRQSGNLDAALALLREAQQNFPESEEVRIELAAVLFEVSPVGVFDLADAAEHVIEEPLGSDPVPEDQFCAIPDEGIERFEPFDPTAFEGFASIEAAVTDLDEISGLLTRTPDGQAFSTLEGRLRALDLCTIVDREAEVLRPYDRAGILADLRDDGLSDLQIGDLLVTYAVTQLTSSYYDLFAVRIPSLNTQSEVVSLHRVREDGDEYITYCSVNAFAFLGVASTVRDPAEAFLRATIAVELRAFLLGYPEATDELLIDVVQALISIQRELATCPT